MERDVDKKGRMQRPAARKALALASKLGVGARPARRLGRKPVENGEQIVSWRKAGNASIRETAQHFGVSEATVKRYCANAKSSAAFAKEVRDAERAGENAAELRLAPLIQMRRILR